MDEVQYPIFMDHCRSLSDELLFSTALKAVYGEMLAPSIGKKDQNCSDMAQACYEICVERNRRDLYDKAVLQADFLMKLGKPV